MQRLWRAVGRTLRVLLARPGTAIGFWITALFLLVAVFGPLVAPHGPTETLSEARVAPSAAHLFGTDHLGRDVFSRVLYGTRSVISLAGFGALLAIAAGLLFGMASGYRGGLFDEVLMRVFDSLLSIPALLLALLLLGTIGPSRDSILIIIPLLYTPIVARVVRSEVLRLRDRGFVAAARLRGESLRFILFREILPSVLPALSVEGALRFSYAIFLVASLGFLGVGVQPPTPDWGLMVKEARSFVRLTPWTMVFPAGAIALLVIGVNLLADGLKLLLQRNDDDNKADRRLATTAAATRLTTAGAPRPGSATDPAAAILQVEDLTISYFRGGQRHDAVRDVNLRIEPGQTYGLVGESGSGKSTLAMAAMRYLPGNGVVSGGAIRFAGTDLLALDDAQLAAVRGSRLNLVPQDPLSSLNPSQQIGPQLVEALALHGERGQEARPPRRSGRARRARRQPAKGATLKLAARRLLEEVGIADGERVAQSYPHQLSGGMQQRVMMAMALSTEPELLVLDEPTTGLDVTTEAVVLDLVADLIRRHGTSALYITHDLGVVAGIADRVAVLYAGELVEDAAAAEFFQRPLHPYTRGLIDSVPRLGQHKSDAALTSMQGQIPPASAMPAGCVFAPRCPLAEQRCHDQRPPVEQAGTAHSIRCHRWGEIAAGTVAAGDYGVPEQRPVAADVGTSPPRRRMQIDQLSVTFRVPRRLAELLGRVPRRQVRAVDAVNLAIAPGQTLGIVGESGSGKSTIANAILGMVEVASGEIRLGDELLPPGLRQRTRAQLSALQLVAQNPYEALNPYMSVGASLRRPFRRLRGMSAAAAAAAVGRLLEEVGLYRDYAGRLPAELSGGERQRVAIARAIAADTVVALCDEPTSALDVSVQARIIELLSRLQRERKTSYLFISHDLSVVAYLADWIAVAYLGRIVEVGPRGSLLDPPHHPYTEALLSAVSSVDSARAEDAIRLSGDVPSPTAKPLGCPFHTRCPRYLGQLCAAEVPPLQISEDGHQVACHIPLDELRSIQAQRTGA